MIYVYKVICNWGYRKGIFDLEIEYYLGFILRREWDLFLNLSSRIINWNRLELVYFFKWRNFGLL